MRGNRSLARCGLVAVLAAAPGACQLPAREHRALDVPARPGVADAGDAAAVVVVPAVEVDAADAPAGVGPGDVPLDAVDPSGGAPPDPDSGSHCMEPPERIAAREGMRLMAERHARATERLRALRAEFERKAEEILGDLSLENIPAVAAEFVARAAEVPGSRAANAGFATEILREAAFYAVLCRALRSGLEECDRLDSADAGDGGHCRAIARMVRLARERPGNPGLTSLVALALGWRGDRPAAELIWQVALRGLEEGTCDRLAVPDAPDHWALPLCRAVAARDVSRCAVLASGSRRRTCAGLVHAVLGPGAAAGDPPDAVGAMLREWVVSPASGPPCAAASPDVLAELLDAAGVFDPGPLVLPDIERERGLAQAP